MLLPALTVDEETLRQHVEEHVEELTKKVGERHASESWQLAEAADYLVRELEEMGYVVERQGYETNEVAAQNIAVTITGETQGDQIVIVGAHYDTKIGEDGRAGGSTDAAVLLELSRLMQFAKIRRSLRFVFFSMGESPHGDDEGRGARQYIRSLAPYRSRGSSSLLPSAESSSAKVVAFLQVDEWGSIQEREIRGAPTIEVEGTFSEEGAPLGQPLRRAFDVEAIRWSEIPFEKEVPGQADSDAWVFRQLAIPVAVVSGIGQTVSSSERPPLGGVARAAMCLRHALGEMVGERPINDGMLTPGHAIVR